MITLYKSYLLRFKLSRPVWWLRILMHFLRKKLVAWYKKRGHYGTQNRQPKIHNGDR